MNFRSAQAAGRGPSRAEEFVVSKAAGESVVREFLKSAKAAEARLERGEEHEGR
jgi:hypothetical protein